MGSTIGSALGNLGSSFFTPSSSSNGWNFGDFSGVKF
jgi:hypothetical protein